MQENEVTKSLRADIQNLQRTLPGLEQSSPGEFFLLAKLLQTGTFELLPPKEKEDPCRIVYLMNDGVESFLTLENATMTGTYDPEQETTGATLSKEEERYVLTLKQESGEGSGSVSRTGDGREKEDHFLVLFFTDIHLEVHPFDYGAIGHFWVKGHALLRQIQYKAEILDDRRLYLGEDYCTKEEIDLASLYRFPPLSYLYYAGSPVAYVRPRTEPYAVEPKAAEYLSCLAEKLGETRIVKEIEEYAANPTKKAADKLAAAFGSKRYGRMVVALTKAFRKAGEHYERRHFPENIEGKLNSLLSKGKALQEKLPGSFLFREEPFLYTEDDIEPAVYVVLPAFGPFGRDATSILKVNPSEPR